MDLMRILRKGISKIHPRVLYNNPVPTLTKLAYANYGLDWRHRVIQRVSSSSHIRSLSASLSARMHTQKRRYLYCIKTFSVQENKVVVYRAAGVNSANLQDKNKTSWFHKQFSFHFQEMIPQEMRVNN